MNDFLNYLIWLCETKGTPDALRFAELLRQPPAEPETEEEQIATELARPAGKISRTAMRIR